MVSEDGTRYIVQEYIELWKDYGVQTHISESKLHHCTEHLATAPSLDGIRSLMGNCRRCGLCEGRKTIVFGQGAAQAQLLFVGEGPGADEDAQGIPFVGRAGILLTKIIEAMGYRREEVYIANIVKCRPPGNRTPTPEEVEHCTPFLLAQIKAIQPKVIVALGSTATLFLLNAHGPISGMRGKFHPFHYNEDIPVMPTYHPAYLLRNPSAKKLVWDDVKMVKDRLDNNRGSA